MEPMEKPKTTASANAETIIEGTLLKRGSRGKYWHDRYFVLKADNTLHYYSSNNNSKKQQQHDKPKGVFSLNDLRDAEVSELFLEKHQKEVIYCVRLSWSGDASDASAVADSQAWDDSSSLGLVSHHHQQQQEQQDAGQSTAGGALWEGERPTSPAQSRGSRKEYHASNNDEHSIKNNNKLRTPFKVFKRKKGDKPGRVARGGSCGVRSVDSESLTFVTGVRRRAHTDIASPGNHNIPSMVEVDPQRIEPPRVPEAIVAPPPIDAIRKRSSYERECEIEQEYLHSQYLTTRKESKKKYKRKVAQGAKVAVAAGAAIGVTFLTAGIGLIAGLVVLGAAAGGGSAAFGAATWQMKSKDHEIIIASLNYDVMKAWKSCLEAALKSDTVEKSRWGQLFVADGRNTRNLLLPFRNDKLSRSPSSEEPPFKILFENISKWIPLEGGWTSFLGSGVQNLRIYREQRGDASLHMAPASNKSVRRIFTKISVDGKPCHPMKSHVVVSSSALDCFLCLMSYGRIQKQLENPFEWDCRSAFTIVEQIDDHTDIIHLMFRPIFLFPSWSAPRDYVLYRYWRLEQDGSYVICYESVEHPKCPHQNDFVRGEMHQVFTIAPQKKTHRRKGNGPRDNECLLTAVVQVDPKGWVPVTSLPFLSNQSYGDAFGVAALLQLLDIRDTIDQDRFVATAMDDSSHTRCFEYRDAPPEINITFSNESGDDTVNDDNVNYDFSYAGWESARLSDFGLSTGLASVPPPLPAHKWAEPDANSFRVRGALYKEDKKKINAGVSIGQLIAVDVVAVDQPIYTGFSVHPTERIQLALQKEELLRAKGVDSDMPPFIFVVNIVLPGPPYYHGLFFYAVDDMAKIDGSNGTASSKLCQQFFFGDSDEFRDRTFKLIPQIVEGNFIVRKAVGSTPAIMGKKLRQLYVKGDRFFEVILDCGSSPVATGVIRLSLGYAKTLVVDMGFLLEGDDETTLPERIFGCVRMKQVEFGPHLRKVEQPTP